MGTVDHYFTKKPTSKPRYSTFTTLLRGNEITIKSSSGVFSREKVDTGSRLLINKCIMDHDWRVLDLGCGYGVIGIALAKAYPGIELVMSDINERAVALARENVELNQVSAQTVQGNGYENVEGVFDCILLNPPQTAGKKLCLQLIADAKKHLKVGGCLQIVARHQKGGKSLSKFMEEIYDNMDVVAKGSGYRIYISYRQE